LDTLIFSDYWRKKLGDDNFSETFYDRARAALNWLILLTDEISNNAPNVGANDGTLLLNNHACDYRDFRPSIQTASVLFNGKKYYENGLWDEPCYWFDLRYENAEKGDRERTSTVLPGGYVIMIGKDSWGMIRFPMFRFRPSHNDVFHFDLWFRGQNICRDAGSYSYNSGREADNEYFRSVKAHNTVSFDNREQMPRLGRFLLGKWIHADHIGIVDRSKNGGNVWTGAYRDCRGNRHQRDVSWRENTWVIQDRFSGSYERAELIFRLIPTSYNLRDNKVTAPWGSIEISPSDCQIRISTGFESNYYWEKKRVDSLAIIVGRNSQEITTRFVFN
jgi:hypothetical protein